MTEFMKGEQSGGIKGVFKGLLRVLGLGDTGVNPMSTDRKPGLDPTSPLERALNMKNGNMPIDARALAALEAHDEFLDVNDL